MYPPVSRGELEQRIGELGLKDAVRLLALADNRELPCCYLAASVA